MRKHIHIHLHRTKDSGEFKESEHPRAENGKFGSGGASTDPAQINVSLHKRGNINAQIDKYKEQQAQLAKAKAKETAQQTKGNKILAKSLLDEHLNAIIAKHGAKFGEKELKHTLEQWQKWEPSKLINFVDKFRQESMAHGVPVKP